MNAIITQCSSVDHVEDTTRCSNDNMDPLRQFAKILTNVGSTNASVALCIHIVTKSQNNLSKEHRWLKICGIFPCLFHTF